MAVLTSFYRRAETLYAPKNRAKLIISLLSLSPVEKKNQNSLWSTLVAPPFWCLLRLIWVKCRAEKKKSIGLKKKILCFMVSLLSMLTSVHSDLTKCNNPKP